MSLFASMKISTKIYAASVLGLAVVAGMLLTNSVTNMRIADAEAVVAREQTILAGIQEAQVAYMKMQTAARDVALSKSVAEMDAAYNAVDAAKLAGQQALQTPISIAVVPKALQDINDSLNVYGSAIRVIGDYVKSTEFGDLKDLAKVRAAATTPIRDALQTAVETSVQNARRFTGEAKDKLDATKQSANQLMLVFEISLLVILIGTSFMFRTVVVRPLRTLTEGMVRLSKGDTSIGSVRAVKNDEIGQMYQAFEVFRQNAIEKVTLEADAGRARVEAEQERRSVQQRAEAEAAGRLAEATAGLAGGLRRLASGNLSFRLTEAFSPDFEPLRLDFNKSVDQLNETLSLIASGIQTMDHGTREIASGANDLSKRTEQQAASLEETAAAVEQITSNVANSTKRTEEARNVAMQANDSASRSAQVVSDAEEAMRKIEESAQQISNIIGVIDEIAFQTNLLALNAGVEAARAGDAGKGFAVVAQEVRELAQRAAQAAKEIKGLIQNSSMQVESGVKLVRDTGEALKTIGGFIIEMNSHMESIATSAREQSTGLKEVNQAVNVMDQSTQQNAAMVEQATAASGSLAEEAVKLRELIAQFTLSGADLQVANMRQVSQTMATQLRNERPKLRQPAARKVAAAGGPGWEDF
ncbi:methyl-accepting chemotaxis protein [Allorhizobium undicola]|uniref:methyl-accepting chemotaxis protein n=1 Tax=Allorhizobium undicola TaxID=78527 RepID=UPI0006853FD8|nr:methyl-accepting chemotaxis protein [Allorhizobium undicola]